MRISTIIDHVTPCIMEPEEERLRLILDNMPALVAILDGDQRYRFANRQHVGWFGEDPGSLAGRHFREVVGDAAWQVLRAHCEQALCGEDASYTGDIRFVHGGEKFVHATVVPLQTRESEIEGILVQLADLTELRFTRRALDTSTVRSRTILDTAVDAILTIDANGIVQSCNSSTEKLFGYTPKELIGNNVTKLMPERYAVEHDDYMKRYLSTGEAHIIGIGREVTARRKDGTEFPIHLAVGEFSDRGLQFFTGFIRDMTAQKEAEQKARAHLEQLAHVTRLSAIDNLASGISHEVNQPLTAIVTMSQALLRTLRAGRGDPAVLEDTLERIVQQGARANTIVQQMREFARKEKTTELSPHRIADIIRGVLQLLEYELGQYGIVVEGNYDDEVAPVTVNRIQVEQVLLNLIQNAIHAMADITGERKLTITTASPRENYPYVDVTVSDTGIGLPEYAENDVFDPFFTTKEQGMGQGLAISRSIVEAHGGSLIAGNNDSAGAVFRFNLPADVGADV